MEKQGKILAPILCAMMPLIPLTYLYTRNADYINAMHVAVVGAAMAALSLIGYGLLRLIFKSRLAALLGCLTACALFFAMRSVVGLDVFDLQKIGFSKFLAAYGLIAILLTLAVSFAARGRAGGRLYPALLIFLGVLLIYNAVPAVRTGIASERDAESVDLSKFKTQFNISKSAPSPNVYWFHCDGMLGFDAFEKYFGDDQAEFAQALADRGFQIDRGAMVETVHTTKIAVPALMCPYFYDNTMREVLRDHETAMTVADSALSAKELQYARLKNETRVAFEQKGYYSETFGNINIFFPPVSNRLYGTKDASTYVLEPDDDFKEQYLSIIEAGELVALLTGMPDSSYFRMVIELGERGLLRFRTQPTELTHELEAGSLEALYQDKKLPVKSRTMLNALNEATYIGQPTFNIICYLGAHFPFENNENGEPNTGDTHAIQAYAPQHRYAAFTLLKMIDIVLARDPDAVIVLQGDHGLHGQSKEEITAAFGEDAVIPIWNQVMSALRVPEKYRNGQETYALSNPLNMSRYLVNSFVGENYAYIQ